MKSVVRFQLTLVKAVSTCNKFHIRNCSFASNTGFRSFFFSFFLSSALFHSILKDWRLLRNAFHGNCFVSFRIHVQPTPIIDKIWNCIFKNPVLPSFLFEKKGKKTHSTVGVLEFVQLYKVTGFENIKWRYSTSINSTASIKSWSEKSENERT